MAPTDTHPAPAAPASPTLARLLDADLALSPSIQGIYSSHLAMQLVALEQMGAAPSVLQGAYDEHLVGEAERRDDVDDLDRRRAEVARDGIAATVRARAATLVDGPGTALFHPMIRLAYALDVGHEGQVAAALLDWERRHHVLPRPDTERGDRRLPDVAAVLAGQPAGTWPRSFDLDGISRRPEVDEALRGLALDGATLDDGSSFALAAHLAADDFITLHMVTGARAARAVSAWLDGDVAAALAAHSALTMVVAFAAVGAPPLLTASEVDRLRSRPLPSRREVEARATADPDPHVVKLANVALVEELRTADPAYRFIAARVVGLVPPAREALAAA